VIQAVKTMNLSWSSGVSFLACALEFVLDQENRTRPAVRPSFEEQSARRVVL